MIVLRYPTAAPSSGNDVVTGAGGAAATLTYAAAGAGVSHVISGIGWSYDTTPTGGSIEVLDGSTVVFGPLAITTAGPGFFNFPVPKSGSANTALHITLAAGGGSVVANVSALNHWTM